MGHFVLADRSQGMNIRHCTLPPVYTEVATYTHCRMLLQSEYKDHNNNLVDAIIENILGKMADMYFSVNAGIYWLLEN